MSVFIDLGALRAACLTLPAGSESAAVAVRERQMTLTKPLGSLGRLEELAAWLARWQNRPMPRLDRVDILVFAGNHGVTQQGVSPFPATVTAQMVANFARGGAAINQIAGVAGAILRVVPLDLDEPTQDFTLAPAMNEAAFLAAVSVGYDAVPRDSDLLCLGEMGIGNTTAAAAIAAALFGGGGSRWAGRGTGIDDAGLARKRAVIDIGLERHATSLGDPLLIAMALGGRELAAILGAVLAARQHGVPVLLDGFVCTAAAAPLARLTPGALDHTMLAHLSAEAGHRFLAEALNLRPLLDFDMRLGEASAATLVVPLLRAAVACHNGMATFAEAAVDDRA
ncbi:MAG: nicotinate-nucleotide--dimethylbenzimidazole phosphoribosyltransferase [Acetobacteraceae bacterium]|jgi:nicotinate-nucleotide--dimethylbenzimidazole phosphoribosyltransferase|nr:nicotinate-nucleotide--dimethylbenzimidazole phosphoribosyltransferase [Acetobacteraceae bacterium]